MTQQKKINTRSARIGKILDQAKDSLKILETFEKEAITKAKTFIPNLPNTEEALARTMKKLGFATLKDIQSLKHRLDKVETQIESLKSKE